jgi:hypothetical protein
MFSLKILYFIILRREYLILSLGRLVYSCWPQGDVQQQVGNSHQSLAMQPFRRVCFFFLTIGQSYLRVF